MALCSHNRRRSTSKVLVLTPANLPSFIIVPPEGRFGANQVADAAVVMVLLLATGVWLARRTRA